MTATDPTALYVGKREDIIREVGGSTYLYPGKYLLQLDGDFPAEGAGSKKDALAFIKDFEVQFPGIEIRWI